MNDLSFLSLPEGVTEKVRFYPFEDVLVKIFERGLPSLKFRTFIPESLTYPLVVGRRYLRQTEWSGDPRFVDTGYVRINVFTEGPHREDQGFFISEAIRVMMLQAHLERWSFPGIGSVCSIDMMYEPEDGSDWATASGIVQAADLPKSVLRYETIYRMTVRRPRNRQD